MGYYIQQTDSDIFIPKELFPLALQAIKKIMLDTKKMNGGSWDADGPQERWYSWVDTSEVLKAETLKDALDAWRWEAYLSEGGDIADLTFVGEKSGQDEILLNVIAPYVKEGSYVSMRGEDGELWRWYFDGERCVEKYGRVVYE
jgi:hypothetical protein